MAHTYSHPSLEERRRIAKWRDAKMPISEITDRLDRDASTVYRDLRPNYCEGDDDELLNDSITITSCQLKPTLLGGKKRHT